MLNTVNSYFWIINLDGEASELLELIEFCHIISYTLYLVTRFLEIFCVFEGSHLCYWGLRKKWKWSDCFLIKKERKKWRVRSFQRQSHVTGTLMPTKGNFQDSCCLQAASWQRSVCCPHSGSSNAAGPIITPSTQESRSMRHASQGLQGVPGVCKKHFILFYFMFKTGFPVAQVGVKFLRSHALQIFLSPPHGIAGIAGIWQHFIFIQCSYWGQGFASARWTTALHPQLPRETSYKSLCLRRHHCSWFLVRSRSSGSFFKQKKTIVNSKQCSIILNFFYNLGDRISYQVAAKFNFA